MSERLKHGAMPALSLFTSVGTLLCCALPALLVSIGAGAALAGLVSTIPQLVWLSRYKLWVFAIAGGLLLITGIWRYVNRNALCPADPELGKACMRLRKVSSWLFYGAVAIYLTGVFFAFVAPAVFA